MFGAVSEDGEEFYCQLDEYITGEHARKFILALSNEFDDYLIIVLDGTPYFRSSSVTELADRDDLEFVQLPPYSPDMNPVEECWRQLKKTLKNRFFEDLDELKRAIQRGLNEISTPNTSDFL